MMRLNEKESIHQSIKLARKQLLDLLQCTYGHQRSWRNVRAMILRIMGRNGLELPFIENQTDMENDNYDNNNS